jgi:lipopolysaccharide/colanic/teichoic acid biosynthesis glycosyltransferase
LAGLAVSSPVWLVVVSAIKLDDGGPIFHTQLRRGRNGRLFRVLKFRSMRVANSGEHDVVPAAEHDPRVTRFGRVMRACGLDELPQLVNILIGDMSFVGPRALMPAEVEGREAGRAIPMHEIPGYDDRAAVTPGLTGLAQIYARRDVPRRSKFRIDRLYVTRQSFWLDLRLIVLSFWISLRGAWEVRGRKF